MLNILVIEGQHALAERISAALRGFPVQIEAVQGLFGGSEGIGRRASKPALVVVNASVLDDLSLSPVEWEAVLGVPVLWVEKTPRRALQEEGQFHRLDGDFTASQLLAAVEALLPGGSGLAAEGFGIVAESRPMRRLMEDVAVYAAYDAGVLLLGETGTGKERIARALHDGNPRRACSPFVAVNCGAVPEGLFESLFMGHTKGAFTGAVQAHAGYFEQADGGTLFLDEIGDLPLHQQVKLLRVLEERRVLPVGCTTPRAVDFRLVAATNRDLEHLVRMGEFRADLYYRLAVVVLRLPSVDERGPADKLALFRRFFRQAAVRYGGDQLEPPDWVAERIQAGRYPGNVRQLANLAERLAIMVVHHGDWSAEAVAAQLGGSVAEVLSDAQRCERERILEVLGANGWRRQESAEALGISRKALWEKMRRFGIREAGDEGPVVPMARVRGG